MAPYSLQMQARIVIAACVIHNYIRKKAQEDSIFIEYADENMIVEDEVNAPSQAATSIDRTTSSR